LGFRFFVGDVISEVGLGLFDRGYRPWAQTIRGKCFSQDFTGN